MTFLAHFTTQRQLALVTCAHQSAAILAGRSTVPVSYPNKPALRPLSMQSAEDPCPRAAGQTGQHKQTRCPLNHLFEFGAGKPPAESIPSKSDFKYALRTHELQASFYFN